MLATRYPVFIIIIICKLLTYIQNYINISRYVRNFAKVINDCERILFLQMNCSEHEKDLHFLPIATVYPVSSRLQFGTAASQTSIHSFSLQFLSPYSGVAFSPFQLIISHSQKSWSLDPWRVHLPGRANEDW